MVKPFLSCLGLHVQIRGSSYARNTSSLQLHYICRGMQDCQTGVRPRPSHPDFEKLGTLGNVLVPSVKRAWGGCVNSRVGTVPSCETSFVCAYAMRTLHVKQQWISPRTAGHTYFNVWSRCFCFCRYWGVSRRRRLSTKVSTVRSYCRLECGVHTSSNRPISVLQGVLCYTE